MHLRCRENENKDHEASAFGSASRLTKIINSTDFGTKHVHRTSILLMQILLQQRHCVSVLENANNVKLAI